jgi:hypothetical protein
MNCLLTRTSEARAHDVAGRSLTMSSVDRAGVCIGSALAVLLAMLIGASESVRADPPPSRDAEISRCAKTPHSEKQNYYQETADCSSSKSNWTLVVQAESGTLGQSCIGPSNQSFLINAAKSPVTLGWIPRGRKSRGEWTVNLKVDTESRIACSNQYTFFGFMKHADHGGGPLPKPSNLQSFHELSYDQFTKDKGEVRLTLGAQAFWNGKAHILELLPARIGYKANPGFPPGIIQKITTPTFDYVIIDDSWGTSLNPGSTTQSLSVNWSLLFAKMISLGMFSKPHGETATQAVYVAVETHNRAVGNLYQSKFMVAKKGL